MRERAVHLAVSLAGLAAWTWVSLLVPVNATTAGFGYLLIVLVIASAWGFVEALAASVAAMLSFNFFFFPPIGRLHIQDPQNWVALLSFLATSVIASRLSAIAKRRALDAVARRQDLEHLYGFSRGILMIGDTEPFPKQLVRKLAEIFQLRAAVLFERHTGEFYSSDSSGPGDLDEQLREVAVKGTSYSGPSCGRRITPIRLESETIASLALEGGQMPDSVVQGIANLVAIGLERARAQDLAHQVEAARQSEQLRTTLIDAMAHEFKTPLTSIKAATTSLLAEPAQSEANRLELLRIADEEADHLRNLVDNAVDMARLDTARIDLSLESSELGDAVRQVIASMRAEIDTRLIDVIAGEPANTARFDPRLVKLAIKQLVDNALKYSPPETSIRIRISQAHGAVRLDVTSQGDAISLQEQKRLFDRFYRSAAVKHRIPGSGLGLTIAQKIARAHKGDLTVTSGRGETTFRLTLPFANGEERG